MEIYEGLGELKDYLESFRNFMKAEGSLGKFSIVQ
jgi:hypothetical protein